ncbi:MAG: peptide ABC transporter substrate-binding protein [Bdellovibrionaceae bacterium]|nr:peptide ABC transporter substrate-binding protein [Pseudobdellovibrionaceae bacterium]
MKLLLLLALASVISCNSKSTNKNSVTKKEKTFYIAFSAEPTTLNPFSSSDTYSSQVQVYVFDTLLVRNINNYKLKPGLAERYEVGPKEKYYTFYLRKGVQFHDGKPLTAEDVKFSFDAIMDDAFKAAHQRPYYENIKSVKVISPLVVRFYIKKRYFQNLSIIAGMQIVSKHFYKDPKKKLNKVILGSGPYILGKYDKGRSITLKKNKKWWGHKTKYLSKAYKFDRIFIRIIRDENLRFESLKKEKIDFVGLTADQFVKKTKGKPWGTKVFAKKVANKSGKGFGFVGWNLQKPMFKNKKVRQALTHLMNRDLMNKKFKHGMSTLATGPWYIQSDYASPRVKPLEFSSKKAAKLLKSAGWKDSNKDGILEKNINGKLTPFRFTLLFASAASEKYLTIYKEDLKKEGIDVVLKQVEWNSFVKALDEKKFEAVMLGWSGSIEIDPKQIWHSSSSKNGGSNFISYSNKQVDNLIEKGRLISDRKKRIRIFRKVFELIANDAPYVFLFNDKYTLYGHTGRMDMKKPTYKYSIGTDFWKAKAE